MSSNKYKFLFEVEFYNWDILFSELYSKVKKKVKKKILQTELGIICE